jgi:Lanthionine synthetase C-like protein
MLHDPARHEALGGAPWSDAAARSAIQSIADDVCARFDPATLWPVHPREREEGDKPVPQPMLYNGAAGVLWALGRLRTFGAADVALNITPIVDGLHEHSARWITAHESEWPSYFLGHSAVLLLQWRQNESTAVADALFALVEGNLHNKVHEALWGSSGTLIAALHMLEATREERWRALFVRGVDVLWEQMVPVRHSAQPDREVWIWKQDLYGRTAQYMGAGHGFAGNVFPVLRGARWLDPAVVERFEARTLAAFDACARREAGLVHWEPQFDPVQMGFPARPLLQDCHGEPGIICRLATTRSAPLQALLVAAGENVWQAGPLSKRPGLCHGTDGNGFAFLKLHAMTGDAKWLDRARSFAMHAIQQSEALAVQHGMRVPSLWTGDLGLALYLQSCITAEPALPTLDVF